MHIVKYILDIFKALFPLHKSHWVIRKALGAHFGYPVDGGPPIPQNHFTATGTYRFLFGMKLVVLRVEGNLYWPQGSVHIDPIHGKWSKDIGVGTQHGKTYTLVLAAVSDDFRPVLNYYGQVHDLLLEKHGVDDWLPITMNPHENVPGFVELDRVSFVLQ